MLIFVQSKDRAKELFNELIYDGLNIDVIHAERTQTQVCIRKVFLLSNIVVVFVFNIKRYVQMWLILCKFQRINKLPLTLKLSESLGRIWTNLLK